MENGEYICGFTYVLLHFHSFGFFLFFQLALFVLVCTFCIYRGEEDEDHDGSGYENSIIRFYALGHVYYLQNKFHTDCKDVPLPTQDVDNRCFSHLSSQEVLSTGNLSPYVNCLVVWIVKLL
ncbi:hypothetical protein GOODEAATRI_009823 [Goodea atripinnis]|uniref:Uncharacterized protein n=1 Tax=Goodea atripinnis TaxID=208336 RepID=A0ABV0PMC2_9TELE